MSAKSGKELGKTTYRTVRFANKRFLRGIQNTNLRLFVPHEERNSPFTITPQQHYDDFHRDQYQRNKVTFPVVVPLRRRVFPFDKDEKRFGFQPSKEIDFTACSGNELLLCLKDFRDYSPLEINRMFVALSHKNGVQDLKLEDHPYVRPAFDHYVNLLEQSEYKDQVDFALALERLGFTAAEAWLKLRVQLYNKAYALEKLPTIYFTHVYRIFHTCFPEMIETEQTFFDGQLPRFLKSMPPKYVAEFFEMLIDRGAITSVEDYVFNNHFQLIFLVHSKKFQLPDLRRILVGLKKIGFAKENPDYFIKKFIPAVQHHLYECTEPEEMNKLITEIEDLENHGLPLAYFDALTSMIKQRLLFVERDLERVNKTDFIEIVKQDLADYKERRIKLLSLAKKRNEAKKASESAKST